MYIILLLLFTAIFFPLQAMEESLDKYAINLMWIHKQENTNPYIYRLKNEEEQDKDNQAIFEEEVVTPLHSWADKNPAASIIFWYDSLYTPDEAIQRTSSYLLSSLNSNVMMKDIRDLPFVKKNEKTFSSFMPVYFRSDLLRAIIPIHQLKEEKFTYSVYADLDVETMTQNEIFDDTTRVNLEEKGIVMASAVDTISAISFENSFQIVSYHQPFMLEALYQTVIRPSVARSLTYTNKNDIPPGFPEAVFAVYPYALTYFAYLKGQLGLYLREDETVKYNPEAHFDKLKFPCLLFENFWSMLKTSDESLLTERKFPTKKIQMKAQGGRYH